MIKFASGHFRPEATQTILYHQNAAFGADLRQILRVSIMDGAESVAPQNRGKERNFSRSRHASLLLNRIWRRDVMRIADLQRERSMAKWSRIPALIFGMGLMALPAAAQPASSPRSNPCFFVSQFENWRAPDTRTINIRVRGNHYYRLGLGNECFPLRSPSARLITTFRGSNTICSPLDWDLQVSEAIGSPPERCIVKTMTELSPAEVAVLPKKAKP